MEVSALYGPSGTGKSTSALAFAYSKGITTIIDDGLLIHNGRKAAGYSAKYEKNYISAVKRAIFFDEDHLREVQEAIRVLVIDKILIIGTSKRMVDLIAERLGLGKIDHYYPIEAVRTSKEIKMALYNRSTQEKHVIPVPYEDVDHGIIKRIIQRGKKIFFQKKKVIGETTIVQPNFRSGLIHISEDVFKQIIAKACTFIESVEKCNQVEIEFEHMLHIAVAVTLYYEPEQNIFETALQIQKKINEDVVNFLQIEPEAIDVRIAHIVPKKKRKAVRKEKEGEHGKTR